MDHITLKLLSSLPLRIVIALAVVLMPINCAPLEFKGENSSAKQTLASAQQQPSKFGYDFLQRVGVERGGEEGRGSKARALI